MSTNKQALTAESARESGSILFIVAARIARREHFNPLHILCEIPQRVVSTRLVRDAVERTEENLMREVDKIVRGHDHMAKKLKEAEGKLEAAEKRIAELEVSHSKLRETMAALHNTIRGNSGAYTSLSMIMSVTKRAYEESAVAGITVKGE